MPRRIARRSLAGTFTRSWVLLPAPSFTDFEPSAGIGSDHPRHYTARAMGTPTPPPEPPRPDPPLDREREVVIETNRPTPLAVEDFRSLRRWLALLGALAVLATAVAIYALLENEDSADKQRVEQIDSRVDENQERLRRTGEESDVNKLQEANAKQAEENDIRRVSQQLSRLDRRLRRVERDVVDAIDTAAGTGRAVERAGDRTDGVNARVTELAERLDAVEDRQPGGN